MSDVSSHTRVNDILLGPLERPALKWLSAHMPAWVTPDILTLIGIIGTLIIFFSYVLTNISPWFFWLASLGFVINWFGDSLDGSLARYRHIERPRYGFFIDHIVDCACEIMMVLGLGLSPYIRFDVACLALIGYLSLSVMVYVQQIVRNEFRISYGKLGPTEVRVIIIAINTMIFFVGVPAVKLPTPGLNVYDWVVLLITGIMAFIFIVNSYREGRRLAAEEKKAPIQSLPIDAKINYP